MIGPLPRRQYARGAGGIALATVLAMTLAGCHGGKKTAAPPVTTSASSSATATTAPATSSPPVKPTPRVNPLTGVGPTPPGPVIAVKVDDTGNGRPSRGIEDADVLYIEQAEGGLTRMVAVFATHHPVVEAVRSVRASDAELLSQYGSIALVASGGGGDSLGVLARSVVRGVINDRGGPGFSRDANRPVPYNLQTDLAEVASAVHTGRAKPVGFNFSGDVSVLKGAPVALGVRTVVGSTAVTFRYAPSISKYIRTIGGSDLDTASGKPVASPNVLIQLCQVSVDRTDIDVAGNPSQYTHSVGSGRVVLYRNGKRFLGKWSRPNAASATTYTTMSGKPLLMAPGGVIVVLAAVGAPA